MSAHKTRMVGAWVALLLLGVLNADASPTAAATLSREQHQATRALSMMGPAQASLTPEEQDLLDQNLVMLANITESSFTTDLVTDLIARGANPNACCGGNGSANGSALHITTFKDNAGVAAALIAGGADVDIRNGDGETPLHSAAENDAVKVAELLLNAGADIRARESSGQTPLHFVAVFDSPGVARLLLDAGADLEVRDADGRTPLHWAAVMGSVDTATLLVAAGADRFAVDGDGNMPRDLICIMGEAFCEDLNSTVDSLEDLLG